MDIFATSRLRIWNRGVKLIVAAAAMSLMTFSPVAGADGDVPPRQIRAILLDDPVHRDRYLGDMENDIDPIEAVTLWMVADEEALPVRIPHANLSPPFLYEGSDELHFFPDAESALAGGGAIAVANLPAGTTQVLLLLLTENFEQPQYRVIVLDNDKSTFPLQHLRLVNRSQLPIRFSFDEQPLVEIAADDEAQLTFDPVERYQRITIERFLEDAQRWRSVYSRHLQLRTDIRITCLLLPRLQDGEWNTHFIDIYTVREFGAPR